MTIASGLIQRNFDGVVVESDKVTDLGDMDLAVGTGVIHGRVTLEGRPVTGAEGEMGVRATLVDSIGSDRPRGRSVDVLNSEYRISQLDPGLYRVGLLVKQGDGVRVSQQLAEVVQEHETRVDFVVPTGSAMITGVVMSPHSETATSGVRVFVFEEGMCRIKEGEALAATDTNGLVGVGIVRPDGLFNIDNIPAGTFDIAAVLRGPEGICIKLDAKTVSLTSDETVTVQLDVTK